MLLNYLKRKLLKKIGAKKPTNNLYFNNVKYFFSDEFDVTDKNLVTEFFSHLHKVDYKYLFDKHFLLKVYNLKTEDFGAFAREGEDQLIILNEKYHVLAPTKFKKGILLNTYFHENAHEKQYDRYMQYLFTANIKCDAFQKIINFEFASNKLPSYNFRLKEIDARMQATHRYCELLRTQNISYNNYASYEPLTAMFKNISALTNLNLKKDYFNNKKEFIESDNILNYSKLDEINFDTDNYIKLYEQFLFNTENFSNSYLELDEAREVFSNTKLRYEFKKMLEEKFNTYKKDMLFLYSLIQKTYQPSKMYYKYLPLNKETRGGLENMKENHQIYTLKLMYQEYYELYCNQSRNTTYNQSGDIEL